MKRRPLLVLVTLLPIEAGITVNVQELTLPDV